MEKSHERIVEGASRMLRERGFEKTSVADVMEAAGLTHGGFYRHFETKDALVASAIQAAFTQVTEQMQRNVQEKASTHARVAYHDYYLSEEHLGFPGAACPVATLAGEMARASEALKASFGKGVNQMLDTVALAHTGTKKERQVAAAREFAMLVGAVVIARASDPDTAKCVLEACRPLA
jgi:TetR/AcrR family transcriptional repressor of nem operon